MSDSLRIIYSCFSAFFPALVDHRKIQYYGLWSTPLTHHQQSLALATTPNTSKPVNMLCDRCAAAFQRPTIDSRPYFEAYRAKRNLHVLHPNFASLEAALEVGCGFCHRLVDALSSKKPSRILNDRQLFPNIEIDSFSVEYHLAYGAPSRRAIVCSAIFGAKKSGEELRERATEHMFLSPGKSDPTRTCCVCL